MKRKVIPVLIGLLLIVLILAGAAGVFLFQRYSGSKEEADLNAYFGLNGSQEVDCLESGADRGKGTAAG